MNEITLANCPFCGGTNPEVFPVLNDDAPINPMYCIGCLDCDCRTGEENTIEDAKKTWNRRSYKGEAFADAFMADFNAGKESVLRDSDGTELQDEYKKTVVESHGLILGFEFSVKEETDDDGRKI